MILCGDIKSKSKQKANTKCDKNNLPEMYNNDDDEL